MPHSTAVRQLRQQAHTRSCLKQLGALRARGQPHLTMYVAISSGASPSKSNLNVTILWLWVSSWHSTILSPVLHTCMQRLTTLIPGKAKGTLKLPSNRLYLHLIWSVWVCWTSPGANEHAWISYASSKTFLLAFHFLLLLQSCRSSLYQKQHLDSCSLARERKNNPKIKPVTHDGVMHHR